DGHVTGVQTCALPILPGLIVSDGRNLREQMGTVARVIRNDDGGARPFEWLGVEPLMTTGERSGDEQHRGAGGADFTDGPRAGARSEERRGGYERGGGW